MIDLNTHVFKLVMQKRTEQGLYENLSPEAQDAVKRIYPNVAEQLEKAKKKAKKQPKNSPENSPKDEENPAPEILENGNNDQ